MLWDDNPLNILASCFAFANFVVNAAVAGVIWWRVFTYRVDEVSQRHDKLNDQMFFLAGLGFTILSFTYLAIALGRAGDISMEAWSLSRIASDIGMLLVAVYGAYQMTVDRFRFAVPIVLVCVAAFSSAVFAVFH